MGRNGVTENTVATSIVPRYNKIVNRSDTLLDLFDWFGLGEAMVSAMAFPVSALI